MRRLVAVLLLVAAAGCDRSGSQEIVTAGDAGRGRAYFSHYGCEGCHAIAGVGIKRGQVGPPLDGIAVRAYVGGILPNTPENMVAWIREPQRFAPGTAMPNAGISEGEVRDIVAYLYTLE